MTVLFRLWRDEAGAILSIELAIVATIVVIGMIVGLATYRDSIVQEFGDTALAIGLLDQSYSYETDLDSGMGGVQNTVTLGFGHIDSGGGACDPFVEVTVTVADSNYTDEPDVCEAAGDPPGAPPLGITFTSSNNEGDPLP